jgi:PPM family protein phosphatase
MIHPSPQPENALGLKWSGRTDRGKVRPNNEDAFTGLQFDAREVHHLGAIGESPAGPMDFAFAVSDGMGGHKAGEHASEVAIQKLTSLLPRLYPQTRALRETGFGPVMEALFKELHARLAYLGGSYEECHGMEATLSLCWFCAGRMHFGHIGDSRIYHLSGRTGQILQLTEDDTHVGWLLRNGKINEREARNHPRRNLLQKALGGSNQFVTPQVGSVVCEQGDKFLLCTDGLIKGLYDEQIREMLSPAALNGTSPAHHLVNESLARDGTDNTTALTVFVV